MRVERWNTDRDGPMTEQALRDKLESEGYLVARYVYPPATFFGPHRHAADKADAVVSGVFRIESGGEVAILEAGDTVFVPHGTEHSAAVLGNESVVSLDGTRVGGHT
jgi:quercetin dioxygenase-like cupin family protein